MIPFPDDIVKFGKDKSDANQPMFINLFHSSKKGISRNLRTSDMCSIKPYAMSMFSISLAPAAYRSCNFPLAHSMPYAHQFSNLEIVFRVPVFYFLSVFFPIAYNLQEMVLYPQKY